MVTMAAAATPVEADGRVAVGRLVRHLGMLLARGCDGVALFGTTGEGPGFGVGERVRVLEAVLAAGVPAERLTLAAMSAAAADCRELCRQGLDAGVTRLLVMPPFFFREGVTPAGLERFYGELIEGLGSGDLRLLLYHFPAMSGAAVTAELANGLRQRFGPVVDGIKDSAGDLEATLALIEACPELRVLVGTELHLPQAMAKGGAGTICGLANVAPELIARLVRPTAPGAGGPLRRRVAALDGLFAALPFVPALKAVLAIETDEPGWAQPLPPLAPLDAASLSSLRARHADWRAAADELQEGT